LTVSLTIPAEVQITDASCETTMGEATATPRVKANHSSTSLASQGVLRRVCSGVMARLSVAMSQRNMIYIKRAMTDKRGAVTPTAAGLQPQIKPQFEAFGHQVMQCAARCKKRNFNNRHRFALADPTRQRRLAHCVKRSLDQHWAQQPAKVIRHAIKLWTNMPAALVNIA
jgi:hypothetical protein